MQVYNIVIHFFLNAYTYMGKCHNLNMEYKRGPVYNNESISIKAQLLFNALCMNFSLKLIDDIESHISMKFLECTLNTLDNF